MEKEIENIITKAISNQIFPGCAIGIIKKNIRTILPSGHFTYEPDSAVIKEDSIFDVASITKSVPTASLTLKLIDENKLNLDDQVIKYLPEVKNSYREEILIKHLLTSSVILDLKTPLSSFKNLSREEILKVIFTTELQAKPGTKFLYTNAPSIILGLIAERILGDTLDNLAQKYFFDPLQMTHTTFHPENLSPDKIVPTEIDTWRGLVHGVVHDESTYALRPKIVGSAGLFSTAPDLLNFVEMLLNEGELNNQRYFSKEIIGQIYTNQLSYLNEYQGLGWELNQPRYMGQSSTPHTFGKTGFTGCVVICDIPKQTGLVILSNYTYPKRKADASLINQVRRQICDLVFTS